MKVSETGSKPLIKWFISKVAFVTVSPHRARVVTEPIFLEAASLTSGGSHSPLLGSNTFSYDLWPLSHLSFLFSSVPSSGMHPLSIDTVSYEYLLNQPDSVLILEVFLLQSQKRFISIFCKTQIWSYLDLFSGIWYISYYISWTPPW